jgi:ribosomal protein S18 acetylase RimI-like enzyme
MNKSDKYTIRLMTKEEVMSIAIKWAAKEGWNPGLYDAQCFYNTDTNGFLLGLLNDKPIACISAIAYDNDFGFLGFYIVKQKYRGKGYGLRIWNAAIDYLKTQNIGLDGVFAQQSNYRKSGFGYAYRNIRYEGLSEKTNNVFTDIVNLSQVSFADMLQYDTKFFPVGRPAFLKCWFELPESYSFAAITNGNVTGYCVIRKCIKGYKIGPLFADDRDIAERLFLSANNSLRKGTKIYLDTPEVNQEAISLAEKYGMKKVFETARMYTKRRPETDTGKVFGVTTFELG